MAAAILDEGARRGWSELCYPATYPLQGHASFNMKTKYTLCSPIKITSWNENYGGRNTLDLLYLKTRWWSSHLWGAIPKQPAITKQTLKDVSNKYESIFFIPRPLVNFHINRGDFLLKIRGGPWTGSKHRVHGVVPGPWGGPWTPVHVLYTSHAD